MLQRIRTLASICLLASAASANTIVVDAGGGGAFTDIGSAITAAQNGDVLIVPCPTIPCSK